MTEREKFMRRFAKKRAEGLVDLKFFVRHGDTLSRDDMFADVNAMDELIDNGKCLRIDEFVERVAPQKIERLSA